MEEIYVLNESSFDIEGIIDAYESAIWTDRYYASGDFEIYTSVTMEYVDLFQQDRILWMKESEHQMFIEEIKIEADIETGRHLTVTGKSLESVLNRRILWNAVTLNGNLQDGIQKLINESIISPGKSARRIDNFVFVRSIDPTVTSLTFEGEFELGDNLYDIVQKICESKEVGFKVILNDNKQFVFTLYNGVDRSYSQDSNPHVVFSPSFDNIINSNYLNSNVNYKNVSLVRGQDKEDEEDTKKKTMRTAIAGNDSLSGLKRRELYTDARDISPKIEDSEEEMSPWEYERLLIERGNEDLKEHKIARYYDGEVDTTRTYRYGEHFFMGDIVQLENLYNMESRVRVIEFIYSIDKSGTSNYPTFDFIDNENN